MALRYSRVLFTKHPLAGNVVVYGILYGSSEATQQTIRGEKQYDFAQIGRLAITGTFFAALNFHWYKRLDAFIPGSSKRAVISKVLADQATVGAFGAFAFFAISSALEGKPIKECVDEGVEKWPRTYSASCCFWPIIQLINFNFLTTAMRAPYVASAAFIWSNFLCYLKSDDESLPDTNVDSQHSSNSDTYEALNIPTTSLIPNVMAQTK